MIFLQTSIPIVRFVEWYSRKFYCSTVRKRKTESYQIIKSELFNIFLNFFLYYFNRIFRNGFFVLCAFFYSNKICCIHQSYFENCITVFTSIRIIHHQKSSSFNRGGFFFNSFSSLNRQLSFISEGAPTWSSDFETVQQMPLKSHKILNVPHIFWSPTPSVSHFSSILNS